MKTVYNRSNQEYKFDSIVDIPIAKFQARIKTTWHYRVFPSRNGIAQVEDPENGQKWTVDIVKNECDCTDFYEYQSPCSHAIAAARFLEIDLITLFDNHYSFLESILYTTFLFYFLESISYTTLFCSLSHIP